MLIWQKPPFHRENVNFKSKCIRIHTISVYKLSYSSPFLPPTHFVCLFDFFTFSLLLSPFVSIPPISARGPPLSPISFRTLPTHFIFLDSTSPVASSILHFSTVHANLIFSTEWHETPPQLCNAWESWVWPKFRKARIDQKMSFHLVSSVISKHITTHLNTHTHSHTATQPHRHTNAKGHWNAIGIFVSIE